MQSKIILLFFACIGMALASTYYVSSDGNDANDCSQAGPCRTISHCLTLGPSGSAINISLSSGTYGQENCGITLSSTSNITYSTVDIFGPAGQPNATISCGVPPNSMRQFWFSDLPNTVISLSNLILMNGNGDNGGCVYASNVKRVTVTNTYFTQCQADNGGAIYSDSFTLIFSSRFSYNQAGAAGGALYLSSLVNGTAVDSSLVNYNTARNGAGIYLYGAYLTLTQTNITRNTASAHGGGMYIATSTPKTKGTYNFLGSNITNNTATVEGGGLFAENLNHTWNIFGALFVDNWDTALNGDNNIACNSTAPEFCYACTTKDCVKECTVDGMSSCSQNTTNTQSVLCYGTKFSSCVDPSCTCKTKMSKVEKILIVVISILLVVGVVLILVDVVRFVIRKRQQSHSYTPIK